MVNVPAESEIRALGVPETMALAEALLIATTGLPVQDVKRLVITASRCVDPGAADPVADPDLEQDHVEFEEALELYENLATLAPIDPVDEESEDPLDYVLAIVTWYAANLP